MKNSAAKIGMSPAAVHQPKQPPDRAAFRLGSAAALPIAQARLIDRAKARKTAPGLRAIG